MASRYFPALLVFLGRLDMGLIQIGSFELKPAARAFDTIARWLAGGMIKQCDARRNMDMFACQGRRQSSLGCMDRRRRGSELEYSGSLEHHAS